MLCADTYGEEGNLSGDEELLEGQAKGINGSI
jgi:hypothetical protein